MIATALGVLALIAGMAALGFAVMAACVPSYGGSRHPTPLECKLLGLAGIVLIVIGAVLV